MHVLLLYNMAYTFLHTEYCEISEATIRYSSVVVLYCTV